MIRGILVFGSAALADVAWAGWSMYAGDRRAFLAATWGVLIVLLGAVSVRAYVDNGWYLAPAAAGAWCGTFVMVRLIRGK